MLLKLFKNAVRTLPFFILLLMALGSFGQMHPVANESSIHFVIHNFGFKTGGILAPPEGVILFKPDDLAQSSFQVTIQSSSINTDNDSRDNHLKEEDYFDVKNYPLIRFTSSSIKATGKKDNYVATGTLTIKKTSRVVDIPFTAVVKGAGWQFTGELSLNRQDYGVGGSSTISNGLTVQINVIAQ